jgi:hypothetical protein
MAEFVDYISMRVNDPNLKTNTGQFQRIDPGHYDFEIDKAVFDQSQSGNRTLRVTGRVISEGPMQGRSMVCSYVIGDTDFARGRMKAIVEAIGIETDEQGGFSRQAFVGTRFTADVIAEERPMPDKTTGQMVMKTFTKWQNEEPYMGEQPQYSLPTQAPSPQVQAAPPPQAAAPQAAAPQAAVSGGGALPQASAPRVTPPRRPAPPSQQPPPNGGARR